MGESITSQTETSRIYVACLAAYNNGILHGAWIDASQEPGALWDEVRTMLAASPITGAEEWAIHDYEGFGGVRLAEYIGLDTVGRPAAFIAEHGVLGTALLAHCDDDVDEAREALEGRYLGNCASLADYMQEVTEDSTAIPSNLRYYIDYQAMARDAEINGRRPVHRANRMGRRACVRGGIRWTSRNKPIV